MEKHWLTALLGRELRALDVAVRDAIVVPYGELALVSIAEKPTCMLVMSDLAVLHAFRMLV